MRHLGIVILLLVSLLTPTMACVIPAAHMTPEESACCRMMKGKCGNMRMASHSCCQPTAQADHLDALTSQATPFTHASFVAMLPVQAELLWPSFLRWNQFPDEHSPPLSPPRTITVLRI